MGLFGSDGDSAEIKIELTGAEDATKQAQKLGEEIEKLGKSAEDSGSGFSKLQTNIITANEALELGQKIGQAFVGSIKLVAGAISGLAEAGDKLGDLKGAFESLGGSSSSIDQANKAILGVLPNIELYRLANKGLVAEIPDFNKNFAQIAEYGKKVGESLGLSASEGIDRVTSALIRGKGPALEKLGITLDEDKASRNYAEAMGIVGRKLTENEQKYANQIEAQSQLLKKNQELGEGSDSVSDALEAVSSSFTDQIGVMGLAVNENDELTKAIRTFEGALDGVDLTEFISNLTDLASKFAQTGADAVVAGVHFVNDFARGLRIVGEVAGSLKTVLQPLINSATVLGKVMSGQIPSLEELKGVYSSIGKVEMPSFSKAIDKVNSEMAEANKITKENIDQGKATEEGTKTKAKALKDAADRQDKYNKSLEAGKKAEKEFLDEMNKAEEAFKDLNQEIDEIIRENNLTQLQEDLKKAFELKDLTKAGTLQEAIRKQVKEGIYQGYQDAGGQIDNTTTPALEKKVDLETEGIVKSTKDGIEKGVKDGFLQSELPNYLSEMITNSITTGFTEGFSSENLKDAGNSLSSVFAQEFQNSFTKMFSKDGGGFSYENIIGSVANLGASYGISTLTANATDDKKDVQGGIVSGTIAGASIGTMIVPGIGTAIGAGVGALGGYFVGASGPSSNTDTQQRHETINFIEGLIDNRYLSFLEDQGNIIEGMPFRFNTSIRDSSLISGLGTAEGLSRPFGVGDNLQAFDHDNAGIEQNQDMIQGQIGGPDWATQYWNQFGQEGGESFGALGAAFSEMAGQMGPAMEQVGVIIAENLGGNLDNARMLLQTLGIGAEDLAQSFLNIGLAGEESWHTVEVWMQSINDLTGEGLIGVGDLEGAMNQFISSGGRGQEALISLRNLGIEAMEAGATSMDDLRNHLIATGKFTTAQIDALMAGFAQRGITSLQGIEDASDRTLGGVTADAESLGFAWSEAISDNLKESSADVYKLKEALDTLPKDTQTNVVLKVRTEYSGEDAKAIYNQVTNNAGVPRQ